MSQHPDLAIMDEEMAAAVAQLTPWEPEVDPPKMREGFNAWLSKRRESMKDLLPKENEYKVENRAIQVDGGEITVRCIVPMPQGTTEEAYPILVWFHGGGFTVGNLDMDDLSLRQLCVKLRISIVNVDYRLAPEHPFPTGLYDCYIALKWAAEHAHNLQASTTLGFIVGGSSAGGNLAASVALLAKDDPFFKGRPVTGQFLQIPFLIHPDHVPIKFKSEYTAVQENKEAPMLHTEDLYSTIKFLNPPPTDFRFSVTLAPNHFKLPPAYIQVAGLDPLRDDGFIYQKVLSDHGVKTMLDAYRGMPHGAHFAFPKLKASQEMEGDMETGLKWLLRVGKAE